MRDTQQPKKAWQRGLDYFRGRSNERPPLPTTPDYPDWTAGFTGGWDTEHWQLDHEYLHRHRS